MIRVDMELQQFKELMCFCIDHQGEYAEIDSLGHLLWAKLDKMVNHDLYSKYKTAPTDKQREQARLEYIERRNIPKSFRW